MKIEKINVKENNISCEMCDKGTLNASNTSFVYPYEYVYIVIGDSHHRITICKYCLKKIFNKTL